MLVDETAEPMALPLSLLEDITGGFSHDQEIGCGGFAVVYKGIVGVRAVAVKKLSNAYMHEKQFHGEVECLMRVKHKNVVRFLGYCADMQGNMGMYDGKLVMADVQQRLLCFEYLPNGSLDKHILDAYREWGTCYEIIKGICEGIQYLHENNIIHLDLKPANILLDDNMIPKITDFGLSRCFDENQSRHITKNVAGTMGYLAPELRKGGVIARSADLYSFGIVIIEILTGHRGYEAIEDVLESWSDRLEKSQRHTLCEQIQVCYEIAFECREFNPKKRPASARDIIGRLHEMESIQELRKSAIGILEVGILGARYLSSMKGNQGRLTDPYCVAKYGEKWVRTPTLINTLVPQWNQQCTWDVFDLSTVITVAVYDDCHLGGQDARDTRMGKLRICLATLETDRLYTHYYPLMVLMPSGLKKTGELHLAIRFTCMSWAKMLAMYGKPPLPQIHYTNPISTPQQDYLRFHAMKAVAACLSRAELPIRREVVEYILHDDSPMFSFSLRRSKANIHRINNLLSGAFTVARWFDGICRWKNPLATILVHAMFLHLVCYPELILPMVFLIMVMIMTWSYRWRPQLPPQIDTVLSFVDQALPDELDEEFDTYPTSRPDDVVRMRYDRLRTLAGMCQTVVVDLATQGERMQYLLTVLRWHDPRAAPIFITLSLLVAVVLYLTPFRVVTMVMGLYFLRAPWFRGRTSMLFNFYSRLPTKDDVML